MIRCCLYPFDVPTLNIPFIGFWMHGFWCIISILDWIFYENCWFDRIKLKLWFCVIQLYYWFIIQYPLFIIDVSVSVLSVTNFAFCICVITRFVVCILLLITNILFLLQKISQLCTNWQWFYFYVTDCVQTCALILLGKRVMFNMCCNKIKTYQ